MTKLERTKYKVCTKYGEFEIYKEEEPVSNMESRGYLYILKNEREVSALTYAISQLTNLATLESIATIDDCEGNGYGSALLYALTLECKKKNVTSIFGSFSPSRDVEKTRRFYQNNGYEVYDDDKNRHRLRAYVPKLYMVQSQMPSQIGAE
ncbi:MAG: GNAT family N-acetyltransferase [Clostridia bacterium]|nr:GNAT family N-acetyltransferase [Clostridia bacterium]